MLFIQLELVPLNDILFCDYTKQGEQPKSNQKYLKKLVVTMCIFMVQEVYCRHVDHVCDETWLSKYSTRKIGTHCDSRACKTSRQARKVLLVSPAVHDAQDILRRGVPTFGNPQKHVAEVKTILSRGSTGKSQNFEKTTNAINNQHLSHEPFHRNRKRILVLRTSIKEETKVTREIWFGGSFSRLDWQLAIQIKTQ